MGAGPTGSNGWGTAPSGRPEVDAGRRAGGLDSTEVRKWADAPGIEVKDRGRIFAELVVQFMAAPKSRVGRFLNTRPGELP
jgi:hypothetical protein